MTKTIYKQSNEYQTGITDPNTKKDAIRILKEAISRIEGNEANYVWDGVINCDAYYLISKTIDTITK